MPNGKIIPTGISPSQVGVRPWPWGSVSQYPTCWKGLDCDLPAVAGNMAAMSEQDDGRRPSGRGGHRRSDTQTPKLAATCGCAWCPDWETQNA